jgi:hypothetical protein
MSVSRLRQAVAIAVVALTAAACGGSSQHSSTTSTVPSSTSATSTSATSTSAPSASPTSATTPTVSTGPVRVTLHGANHNPVAGKPWSYSVRVTDAAGHPLAGTVETEFVVPAIGVAGKETPPIHRLKNGVLNDQITFPADSVGQPITMVTVVHTSAGSVAVGWPVDVRK